MPEEKETEEVKKPSEVAPEVKEPEVKEEVKTDSTEENKEQK